jgi:hypothetical protein
VMLFGQGSSGHGLKFISAAQDVELRWLKALLDWQGRTGQSDFATAKAALAALKSEIEGLPAKELERVQAYAANRRADHLRSHLEKFQLRRFKIKGIGPSKEATLRSYGIETAADLTSAAVQAVPGFGPVSTKPLLEWRRKHEATFNYVVTHTAADRAAISAIKNEFAKRGGELRTKLVTGPAALRMIVEDKRRKLAAVDPTLQRLHELRMQSATDLTFLELTMPPVSFTPTPASRSVLTPSTNYRPNSNYQPPRAAGLGQGVNTCPTCGGSMVLRTARKGRNSGWRFYGCARYPSCRGTRRSP